MGADEHVTKGPPAGGFGSAPPDTRLGPAPDPVGGGPRRRLTSFVTAALILVSLSSLLVFVITRAMRYMAVAKTLEVRTSLSTIAAHAAIAYEPAHRVCPSASLSVPADESAITRIAHGGGTGYSSSHSEWVVDQQKDAGFSCLGFEMTTFQHFQYGYHADSSSFTARGRGDLDGDGVFSEFTWSGRVEGDKLVIARELTEKDTLE